MLHWRDIPPHLRARCNPEGSSSQITSDTSSIPQALAGVGEVGTSEPVREPAYSPEQETGTQAESAKQGAERPEEVAGGPKEESMDSTTLQECTDGQEQLTVVQERSPINRESLSAQGLAAVQDNSPETAVERAQEEKSNPGSSLSSQGGRHSKQGHGSEKPDPRVHVQSPTNTNLTTPPPRNTDVARKLYIIGLPHDITIAQVTSFLRGGIIEYIAINNKLPGDATAGVWFATAQGALACYEWFMRGPAVTVGGRPIVVRLYKTFPLMDMRGRAIRNNIGAGKPGMRRTLNVQKPTSAKRQSVTAEDIELAITQTDPSGMKALGKRAYDFPVQSDTTRGMKVMFVTIAMARSVMNTLRRKGWKVNFATEECEGTIASLGSKRNF